MTCCWGEQNVPDGYGNLIERKEHDLVLEANDPEVQVENDLAEVNSLED